MEACLLCLELNESGGSIKANSTQWQELNIKQLIEKYFWPMQTINLCSWLCTTCWEELHNFHKFYTRIENAHMRFTTILKIEEPTDAEFEQKLLWQESTSLIIKEEHDQNLWKDRTTFMQKSEVLQRIEKKSINTTRKLKKSKTTKAKTKKKESLNNIKIPKEITKKQSPKEIKIQKDSVALKEMIKESCSNANSDRDSNNDEIYITAANNENEEKNNFLAENFPISCIICEIPMNTFMALREHFKKYHEQPGYVICCNKKFFKRTVLLDHVHQHLDPNYLRCKNCDKVFATRRVLKVHMNLHDPIKKRSYCCEICGLRFSTRHVLNTHKTRHLSEEEKLFPCLECGKNFANNWTLKCHLRAVHRPKINCDICGIFLVNKSALTLHKNIKHAQGKQIEYICSICSKISTNRHSHLTHIRNAHQRSYDHKCTICDRAFKRPRSLKEHMATHTGTALYSCPWCTKTFKSHSNISKHHRTWHPKEYEEERLKKYTGDSPPKYKEPIVNI